MLKGVEEEGSVNDWKPAVPDRAVVVLPIFSETLSASSLRLNVTVFPLMLICDAYGDACTTAEPTPRHARARIAQTLFEEDMCLFPCKLWDILDL
jgi:hypothetical protein